MASLKSLWTLTHWCSVPILIVIKKRRIQNTISCKKGTFKWKKGIKLELNCKFWLENAGRISRMNTIEVSNNVRLITTTKLWLIKYIYPTIFNPLAISRSSRSYSKSFKVTAIPTCFRPRAFALNHWVCTWPIALNNFLWFRDMCREGNSPFRSPWYLRQG